MKKAVIPVDLGGRSYRIHVVDSDLQGLGPAVADVFGPRRVVIVTNPVVGALYLDAATVSLRQAGFDVASVFVPDGEAHKTVDTWHRLVEDILALGVDRQTPIIALGGGVTGDIAGFAAATVLRGLPLVQVPTTLLAMVDSSVGGKTGVNSVRGKNLVGAFHQPRLVYAALRTLDTLEPAEYRAGLGEVLKHGLIRDPEIVRICEDDAAGLLARQYAPLREVTVRSCRVKSAVVSEDEREAGLRVILNFGHTVGHALETALGHGTLRHGECVGIGMIAEAAWATGRGDCPAGIPERITAILAGLGLPTTIGTQGSGGALDEDALRVAIAVDKKMSRGTLRTPILTGIGRVRVDRIPSGEPANMLAHIPGPLEESCS